MSITSYAQNFEDVMLWRALSHVERGFYIDVGAQEPIIDSVSLLFHEHGWRGVHIEPVQYYADLLREQRPGDTVIQAAVGNSPGVIRFFEISGGGISTADACIAAQHRERGFCVRDITVPCITLASIFDAVAAPEIHWLKIDVEGFEQRVLASWGKSRARPWIVVVESTLPLTQIETHEKWESILIAYGYSPTYFDGLNRYYISDAHPEVRAAFRVPPNIFDDFALNGTANAPFHKLIVARDHDRISEALALAEVQKQAADSELERLIQAAESREALQAERERGLLEQAKQASAECEQIRNTLSQQETEFAARLLTAKQQIATREKEFQASVLAIQQRAALENAEQTCARSKAELERQLESSAQISQAKQEIQNLLQTLAAREREFGAKLLAIQHRAALESAAQTRLRDEQECAMRGQLERTAEQARRETGIVQNTLVQREREFTAQLLLIQEQSHRERAEQLLLRIDQENASRLQYAERERAHNDHLNDLRLDLERLKQNLFQRADEHAEQMMQSRQSLEGVLISEVARGRELMSRLLTTQQQIHREAIEQANRQREQVLALQSDHTNREQVLNLKLETAEQRLMQSEARLKTMQYEFGVRLHAEQEIGRVRQEELNAQQLKLAAMRNSLSWRLTAPLQAAKSWLVRASSRHIAVDGQSADGVNTPPGNYVHDSDEPHSQLQKVRCMSPGTPEMIRDEMIRTTSSGSVRSAQDIHMLLGHQGRQFVECAYLTILNRQPDPEGMHYYVQRLRSGTPKLQIIYELYTSDEARGSGVDLPWLRKFTRWQKYSGIPLIGRIQKALTSNPGISRADTQLRIVEQQVFWLEEILASQIAPLRESVAEFGTVINGIQADAFSTNKVSRSKTFDEQAATIDTLPAQGFDHLSPTAKTVYIKLRVAASRCARGIR